MTQNHNHNTFSSHQTQQFWFQQSVNFAWYKFMASTSYTDYVAYSNFIRWDWMSLPLIVFFHCLTFECSPNFYLMNVWTLPNTTLMSVEKTTTHQLYSKSVSPVLYGFNTIYLMQILGFCCRRVHISERTLQCLNGEFEVEPAFGEKREETLRIAGLKTYFIKKVLKPVSCQHELCSHWCDSWLGKSFISWLFDKTQADA